MNFIRARKIQLILRTPHPDFRMLRTLEKQLSLITKNNTAQAKLRIQALMTGSNLAWRTGRIKYAYQLIKRAVVLAARLDDEDIKLQIQSQIALGIIQVYRGSRTLNDGLKTLKKSRALAKKAQEPVLETEALMRLAIGEMRAQKAASAEKKLRAIEPTLLEIGNPHRLMIWMVNLGEALRYQNKFNDAIHINENLLNTANFFHEDEVTMNVAGNLGLCYAALAKMTKAEDSFLKSLSLAIKRKGGEVIGNATYNLGWLRVIASQWKEGLPWLRKATSIFRAHGSSERAGGALALSAWCHIRLNSIHQAKYLTEQIIKEKLIPTGAFVADFKMVDFVLNRNHSNPLICTKGIINNFRKYPEQRFYLFNWLLNIAYKQNQLHFAEHLIHHALLAAEEANLRIYFLVLKHTVQFYRFMISDSLKKKIAKHASNDELTKLICDLKPY